PALRVLYSLSLHDALPISSPLVSMDRCAEPLNDVGMVLTIPTPTRWQLTHRPVLLKKAVVRPGGLSAPTLTTGSRSRSPGCSGAAKAAGSIGNVVASLPAAATTRTPRRPYSSSRARRKDEVRASSGVSW